MIKNIILDVGKVLVEWDCDSAFRKLGFDDKTLNEVADATVRSADWNEYDRSLLDEEEQLAFSSTRHRNTRKKSACSGIIWDFRFSSSRTQGAGLQR